MRIVVIGAGNLATNLAVALSRVRCHIVQIYSRTVKSAKILAEKVGCDYTNDFERVVYDADLYILSVKDNVMAEVFGGLIEGRQQALWVHTAGSVHIDAIKSERRGVLYPMQTFSKERLVDFRDITFFVEAATSGDRDILVKLASMISDKVIELDSEKRKYLHLAAVFCCNFANHCCSIGASILEKHNVPFEVMRPLLNETFTKLTIMHPLDAQTGPAVRNDINVIENHKDLLVSDTAFREIYAMMSESINKMSKQKRRL